jgi:phosphoribosylformylglycinamidine (FGAM) synthase-like enzyme
MVGVVPSLEHLPASYFRAAGERIVLLGRDHGEHGGAAWLRLLHGVEQGRPPAVDLDAELRLARLLRRLAREGLAATAHDLAEGGLAVALAEACFGRCLGASVDLDGAGLSTSGAGGAASLFSESQARALVSCAPAAADRVLRLAEEAGVPAAEIGSVGGDDLSLRLGGEVWRLPVAALRETWATALPRALGL